MPDVYISTDVNHNTITPDAILNEWGQLTKSVREALEAAHNPSADNRFMTVTELNEVVGLDVEQLLEDIAALTADLEGHVADSACVHGVETDVVGLHDPQTLTNKGISGKVNDTDFPTIVSSRLFPVNGGGGMTAIPNPTGERLLILRAMVDIEVAGDVGGIFDVGVTSAHNVTSDNLLDGVPVDVIGVKDNLNDAGTNGKSRQGWDADQFVTASRQAGTLGAAFEGYLYVEYIKTGVY
jgi:hypothetical protein